MVIDEKLRHEATKCFDLAGGYIMRGKREDALVQYGRGIGYMQALKELSSINTEGLKAYKDWLESKLWKPD